MLYSVRGVVPKKYKQGETIMTTAVISYAQVETYSQPAEHDNWQAMLRYIVRLCDAKDFVDLADKQILCKLVTAARNDVIHSHSTRCIEAIFQALAARGKKAYAKKILRYVSAACGWYERVTFSDKGKAIVEECQEPFLSVAKDKAGYTVHFAQRNFVHGIKAIRMAVAGSETGPAGRGLLPGLDFCQARRRWHEAYKRFV